MKILSIEFKNINSLKGEHRIDFESKAFQESPLFAITGATGSGKTTVLDVISLALFGEVPRLGKVYTSDVSEKGAILTRNQKEAVAKVTYVCNKGKFASLWTISTNRNDNLRDYEMEVYQLEPYERLDLKKSEVPAKNEELIGLNYEQFIKSVILAQGDFAKFLKSNRQERSALLESITGTGIYRRLGQLAYETYSKLEKEVSEQRLLLENEKAKLLPEEQRITLEHRLRDLEEQAKQAEKELKFLANQIELKEEIQTLNKTIEKRTTALTNKKTEKEVFEKKHGETLKNHENIARYAEGLHQWKNKNTLLEGLLKEEQDLKTEQSESEIQKNKLFSEIKAFVIDEFSPEETRQKLQDFFKKVSALEDELKEIGNNYKGFRENLKIELRDFGVSVDELVKNPDKWEGFQQKIKDEKNRLKQLFEEGFPTNVEKQLQRREEELEVKRNALTDALALNRLEKELKKLKIEQQEIEAALKPLPKTVEALESKKEFKSKDLEIARLNQKNWLLESKLEVHRHELEDGKPCPLCGATEHPYKADRSLGENKWEKQIADLEKELNQISSDLNTHKNQLENLQKQDEKTKKQLLEKHEEQSHLNQSFVESYGPSMPKEVETLEKHLPLIRSEIRSLKELQAFLQRENALNRALPLYTKISEEFEKGAQKRKAIKQLYKGNDLHGEVSGLEERWQMAIHKLNNLQEQLKKLGQKKGEESEALKGLENELLPQLNQFGFSEIKAAFSALIPIDTYEKIRRQIQVFKDEINSFLTEINTHNQRKEDLKTKIKTEEDRQSLQEKLASLEEIREKRKSEREEVSRKLKNDQESVKTIQNLQKKIRESEKENRRWKLLNQLIGDSTGNKFNQFAQDLTLRQLVKLANKRLKGINNRYKLQMIPNLDKNRDNLVVSDLDMGGQERAVHTLSGGETFLMSLGLALALSDLASQNIRINSLFIDEGFGTLDPETLDQTLDTLERLQASSSKTIGIISHVDALKERIGTQIQLEKSGQGYSSLKIVSP